MSNPDSAALHPNDISAFWRDAGQIELLLRQGKLRFSSVREKLQELIKEGTSNPPD